MRKAVEGWEKGLAWPNENGIAMGSEYLFERNGFSLIEKRHIAPIGTDSFLRHLLAYASPKVQNRIFDRFWLTILILF